MFTTIFALYILHVPFEKCRIFFVMQVTRGLLKHLFPSCHFSEILGAKWTKIVRISNIFNGINVKRYVARRESAAELKIAEWKRRYFPRDSFQRTNFIHPVNYLKPTNFFVCVERASSRRKEIQTRATCCQPRIALLFSRRIFTRRSKN